MGENVQRRFKLMTDLREIWDLNHAMLEAGIIESSGEVMRSLWPGLVLIHVSIIEINKKSP